MGNTFYGFFHMHNYFLNLRKELLVQIFVKNFPQFIPKIDAYYKHAENDPSRNIKNSSNAFWIHVVRLKSVHPFVFIFLTIKHKRQL